MSLDLDNLVKSLQQKWNICLRNANEACQTNNGLLEVVGKTSLAAVGAGLFVAILGASPLGTLTSMAVVGLSAFCYTSYHYHPGKQTVNFLSDGLQNPRHALDRVGQFVMGSR